ncbi:glycosyltransferase [Klebsiella electrica]|uniref:glycosyltransferase n=1 Tax=Klebsiella electrica TaxID=1259973 RepID=UPI00115260E4|nr:glycosyltransferase [Klebsiella electrica]
MNKKRIVLSGVNMTEGGILTVFREVVRSFTKAEEVEIICLVHDRKLFSGIPLNDNVEFLEYKNIKRSWLKRLYFEYYQSYFLSKKIKADVWLCLHDMSALVHNTQQYVYCHNPTPFYKASLNDFRLDKKFYIFTKLYRYLYGINIKKNKKIIVQQHWIARNFMQWYGTTNMLVSRPEKNTAQTEYARDGQVRLIDQQLVLIYPAVPRVFKNFDVIIQALSYLKKSKPDVYHKIKIEFTFDKDMNPVARDVFKKVTEMKLDRIQFTGFMTRAELDHKYQNVSGLVFPSKLETWGLPLSEAKEHQLPVIASDLPYAHETLGSYPKKIFFKADDYKQLATILSDLLDIQKITMNEGEQTATYKTNLPEVNSWDELRNVILNMES